MKNYIENFYQNRELHFIEQITDDEIVFSPTIDTFEFYIPNFLKKLSTTKDIWNAYSEEPICNNFDLLDTNNVDYLYVDFANLLSPKNRKEKLDIKKQIKKFIETYGYILPFSLEENNKTITRPLSEIKNEIEKFNIIINIHKILTSDSIKEFPPLNINKYIDDPALKCYSSLYDFDNGFIIKDEKQLISIKDVLKKYFSSQINSVISNCNLDFSYFETPKYSITCDSLLEVMYLQFVSNITISNVKFGFCEYCGKLVPIDNYNKNKKHIYCKLAKDEIGLKDRSSCASNAAMQRYRSKNKE